MKSPALIACLLLSTAAYAAQPAEPATPQGHRALGMKYYRGEGVPRDNAKAVAHLEKAVAGGDVEAAIILGKMYEYGMGVDADERRAAHWYVRGAELGNPSAQFEASIVYYKGRGVDRDPAEAAKWWTLAMAPGGAFADAIRPTVESAEAKLSIVELEEGKRRADAWRQSHQRAR